MGDKIERARRNRALFEHSVRDQLYSTIEVADKRLIGRSLYKLFELLVVTEDIAANQGVDISDERIAEYIDRNREHVNEGVDRAITEFICSIVSQEG